MEGKCTKYLRAEANKLIKDKRIEKIANGEHQFNHHSGLIFKIDTRDKSCTCHSFLDKKMCVHLVAACILDQVELNGLKLHDKILTKLRKRKRVVLEATQDKNIEPEATQEDTVHFEYIYEENQPNHRLASASSALHSDDFVESSQVTKRGRGRPAGSKNKSCITNKKKIRDVTKGGNGDFRVFVYFLKRNSNVSTILNI